jgi:hypothetical protein
MRGSTSGYGGMGDAVEDGKKWWWQEKELVVGW